MGLSKHIEQKSVKDKTNIKVLLPVAGKQTWNDVRLATNELSESEGLGYEQSKDYFNQLLNKSIVDSNIRTSFLESRLNDTKAEPTPVVKAENKVVDDNELVASSKNEMDAPATRQPTRRHKF
jgi:hypothetical protein